MLALMLRAYLQLIVIDLLLRWRDFPALYEKVRGVSTSKSGFGDRSTDEICRAVDLACVWYSRQVPCLHRSVVTTMLLRRHGISAFLVIGAQPLPFRAHAWVEVEGRVVNDRPYVAELYPVLDRC